MKYLTGIFLLSFFCGGFVLAQESSYPNWEKAVTNDGMNSLYEAVKENDQFVAEKSREIIKYISNTDDNLKKSKGFFVLGKISSLTSVSFLLKNIDFTKNNNLFHSEIPLIRTYPAQEALIEIGPQVVPEVLATIAKEKDSTKYPFYFNVIYNIYQVGDIQKSIEIFKIVMSNCIAEVKNTEKENKIQEAINSFISSKLETLKRSQEVPKMVVPEIVSNLWGEIKK